jgi:hypothetical protein
VRKIFALLLGVIAVGASLFALIVLMDAVSRTGDTDPVFLVGAVIVFGTIGLASGAGALAMWPRPRRGPLSFEDEGRAYSSTAPNRRRFFTRWSKVR